MTDHTKALVPCPFCGSTDIDPMGWSDGNGNDGPQCNACGATTESLTAWNRRAAQSSTVGEREE